MKLKITISALLLGASAMAQVPLKVATERGTIEIEDATHITYSDDLSEQTVHTASGEEQKQVLNNVWQVILSDTLHNITDYLWEDRECLIFNWALSNGSYGGSDIMKMHYYANFQTDGHQFALFVPVDSGYTFPRPISFSAQRPQVCSFKMTSSITNQITYTFYRYNSDTGEIGNRVFSETMSSLDIINELQQQLLQHTVLFERPEDLAAGIRSGNEYFKTLAGNYIRVYNDSMRVQGPYQMESEAAGRSTFNHCRIVESKQKQNGTLYKLDAPLVPASVNTYDVLCADFQEDNPYWEFFKLCEVDVDLISRVLQLDTLSVKEANSILNNYVIFDGGAIEKRYPVGQAAVALFPNHEFTLYVPTNEAIRQAIADGLPTWESLADKYADAELTDEARAEAKKQVEELLNFVKYHFHFGSEVADKLPFAARNHNTPVVLRESLTTPKLTVSSNGNGTLTVTDAMGNVRNVADTHKNIFVREVWTSKSTVNAINMTGISVMANSPGVIHQIDGVLRYK